MCSHAAVQLCSLPCAAHALQPPCWPCCVGTMYPSFTAYQVLTRWLPLHAGVRGVHETGVFGPCCRAAAARRSGGGVRLHIHVLPCGQRPQCFSPPCRLGCSGDDQAPAVWACSGRVGWTAQLQVRVACGVAVYAPHDSVRHACMRVLSWHYATHLGSRGPVVVPLTGTATHGILGSWGGGGHQQLRHAAHRLCSLFALSTSVISCLLCRLACSGAGYSLVTQPSVGRSLHRPSSTHDCAPLGPATTLARPNIGLHAPSTGPWSFLALDSSGLWCCNLRAAARVAGGGEGELPPKQPARPSPQAAPHSWPTIINAQSSLPSIFCIL